MESAMPNEKFSGARSTPWTFADWLRRTMRKLKDQALPPESWERGLSPAERLAAQRRIWELTESIAAPTKKQR